MQFKSQFHSIGAESINEKDVYWIFFKDGKILSEGGFPYLQEYPKTYPFTWGILVGLLDGRRCIVTDGPQNSPVGTEYIPIRDWLDNRNPPLYHLISRSAELHSWHVQHRFCGICSHPTSIMETEPGAECLRCGAVFYPRLSPAVIVAVLRDDKILLASNRNFREGLFSILAGFVETGETLEECLKREVREEVGIEVKDIQYVSSQSWPMPHSLMIGFVARYAGGEIVPDNKEILEAGWFVKDELPVIPSPGTIAYTIIDAWKRGEFY